VRGDIYPRIIGLLARRTGANTNPPYTVADFYAQYPKFFQPPAEEGGDPVPLIPLPMLQAFIDLAHASVTYALFAELWEVCMGLFIAHFVTLYLQTANDPTGGDTAGLVSSKSVDGVSISYDNSAVTNDFEGWGEFKATVYGLQLITWARMFGIGGLYVR
jgi:hypothetical protein